MPVTGMCSLGQDERAMLRAAKAVLLDWDGCIAIGDRLLPAAGQLISAHADRVVIVSNNSTLLPSDLEGILASQGVNFPSERIFLAGSEAARIVASGDDAGVLMLAAPRLRQFARELGVRLVRHDPQVVLLMRDVTFTYAKLEQAANALRAGARLVVANADLTHPGPVDRLVPETGALLAALLACLGDVPVQRELVGKPARPLFERALTFLGVAPQDAVMVGDNPATDGEGAIGAGIRPLLIGGNSPLRLHHLIEPTDCPIRSASWTARPTSS